MNAVTQPARESIGKLGREAIAKWVPETVHEQHRGQFIAIDIQTGAYCIHEDDYTAVMTLREQQPNAVVWLARAGFSTAYVVRGAVDCWRSRWNQTQLISC